MLTSVMWDVGIGGISIPGEVYMTLFWVYVALTAISLLLYVLSYFPVARTFVKIRFACFSLFIGCVITYLVPLLMAFASPYWTDNGVEEALVFPQHFAMALWGVPLFQLVIIPIVVGLMMVISFYRRRKKSQIT